MFYSDSPITDEKDDVLQRHDFAKHFARYLNTASKGRSSVISLRGKWGSGKTSLLNLIIKELKQQTKPPIIVEFNPWTCISVDRLVPDFLHALRAGLSKSLTTERARFAVEKALRAIERYASVLAPLDVAVQLTGLPFSVKAAESASKALYSNMMSDDDIQSCKEAVSENLQLAFENVLVVIDDIDRLPNDRICLLFQLVAQIADFSHVHYLLAYDTEVVEKAISELQDGDGKRYLEKVVELSIDVPNIPRSVVHQSVQDFLNPYFNARGIDETKPEALRANEMIATSVMPIIATMRDFRRFCNAFEFEEAFVEGDLSVVDLVGIVALKQASPKVLAWMDGHIFELCGAGGSSYASSEAEKYREERCKDIVKSAGVDPMLSETIVSTLILLFPRFADKCGKSGDWRTEQELRLGCRVASKDVYERYRRAVLGRWSYPREAIRVLLDKGLRDEIADALDGGFADGFDFAKEAEGLIGRISSERAIVMAGGVLDSIARSGFTDENNSHGDMYERMLRDLLEKCGKDSAGKLLCEMVLASSAEGLVRISHLLNSEELAHGRLAGKETRLEKQLLEDGGLDELEHAFIRRVEHLSTSANLLAMPGNRMIMYLWDCFDRDASRHYIASKLEEDTLNIVYICKLCVGPWMILGGSGANAISSWSPIAGNFNRYLDFKTVKEQICRVFETERFWELHDELQFATAAVYLIAEYGLLEGGAPEQLEIDQERVIELLERWRDRFSRCDI